MLEQLDALPALTRKSTASYYLRSKGFLHFHIDGDDIYADMKLDGVEFERRRCTTAVEQQALLATVRAALP